MEMNMKIKPTLLEHERTIKKRFRSYPVRKGSVRNTQTIMSSFWYSHLNVSIKNDHTTIPSKKVK